MKNVEGALRFASRERWRKWLEKNHAAKSEALLVIYKRPPKNKRFPSHHAREEALCLGWIDGWFRPIDDERWVMRYSPRRRGSNWSKYNIARARKLLNEGKMTPAGIAKLPRDVLEVWKKHRPSVVVVSTWGREEGLDSLMGKTIFPRSRCQLWPLDDRIGNRALASEVAGRYWKQAEPFSYSLRRRNGGATLP